MVVFLKDINIGSLIIVGLVGPWTPTERRLCVATCVDNRCDQSAIYRVTAELASIFPHYLGTRTRF